MASEVFRTVSSQISGLAIEEIKKVTGQFCGWHKGKRIVVGLEGYQHVVNERQAFRD